MKKIARTILLAVLLAMTLTLSAGCGNMSYGPGNFDFDKVHIKDEKCVPIQRWYDNEIGIEVKLENGKGMYLSEGTYILVEDTCPICG